MSTLDVGEAPEGTSRYAINRSPGPQLIDMVSGYCGYLEDGFESTSRLQVSTASVALIIGFGQPVETVTPRGPTRSPVRLTSLVAGPHDKYMIATSVGKQHGVQIDLTPAGASLLFGVPMHMLANEVLDPEDLMGRSAVRLFEQLCEMGTWSARFAHLDRFLSSRLSVARPGSPAASGAWNRLNDTAGRLTISALAHEVGTSRQHLVTQFREEIGLPPKSIARILRFQAAVGLLTRDDRPDLAAISHACGYYDQAHFNRDFLQLAGSTPTRYLANRLPDNTGVLFGTESRNDAATTFVQDSATPGS